MPRLLVNPDPPEAWPIELGPGTLAPGRGKENDVPIEHPSVSSAHCRITCSEFGNRAESGCVGLVHPALTSAARFQAAAQGGPIPAILGTLVGAANAAAQVFCLLLVATAVLRNQWLGAGGIAIAATAVVATISTFFVDINSSMKFEPPFLC